MKTVTERFEEKCSPEPNTGCWLWTGAGTSARQGQDARYGNFFMNDKTISAHRASYELFRGPIPEGLCIDHKCTQTFCVNPDHLEVVTYKENSRRAIAASLTGQFHAVRTHCPHGHPFSGDNLLVGKKQRHCRQCMKDSKARYRARKLSTLLKQG